MSAPPVASPGLTVRGRRVVELSTAELEAEATLRRSARARAPQLLGKRSAPSAGVSVVGAATVSAQTTGGGPVGRLLVRRELEQYLANLELKPGATLDTVREQYFRLRERYDPRKQSTPDKQRVAQALVDKLMSAYEALSAHYEAKGEV